MESRMDEAVQWSSKLKHTETLTATIFRRWGGRHLLHWTQCPIHLSQGALKPTVCMKLSSESSVGNFNFFKIRINGCFLLPYHCVAGCLHSIQHLRHQRVPNGLGGVSNRMGKVLFNLILCFFTKPPPVLSWTNSGDYNYNTLCSCYVINYLYQKGFTVRGSGKSWSCISSRTLPLWWVWPLVMYNGKKHKRPNFKPGSGTAKFMHA